MYFYLDFDIRAGEGSKSSKKLKEYNNAIRTDNDKFYELLNEADVLCWNLHEKQPSLIKDFSDITRAIISKKEKNNPNINRNN